MNDIIKGLRARADEHRQSNPQLASELDRAAEALGDLQFRAGPVLASQAMERVGEQMRADHAALRSRMPSGNGSSAALLKSLGVKD